MARCELSIVKDHYFTPDKDAATLKVTIKDARYGEDYYLFFPFKKNPGTKDNNTRFSIMYQSGENTNEFAAQVYGGEIVKKEDGRYQITNSGEKGHNLNAKNMYVDTHLFNDTESEWTRISDYEDGRETGIGLVITPMTDESQGNNGGQRI